MSKQVRDKNKRLTALMLIVALALAAHYSTTLNQKILQRDNRASKTATSNYNPVVATLRQVKSFSFNEHGQLESSLLSPQIIRYKDETQDITTPTFYSYAYNKDSDTGSEEIWRVQSDMATYDSLTQQTELQKNVQATSTSTQTNTNIVTFTTQMLHIDHKLQTAYSNQAINIISATGSTQSQSMSMQLQSRTVSLKNQVKSNYEPAQ